MRLIWGASQDCFRKSAAARCDTLAGQAVCAWLVCRDVSKGSANKQDRHPRASGDRVFQRQRCLRREVTAYWMPRLKPIRFTHLKNRLKDKDLDDPRSQKARELRSSMIAEKTRVFPFHKRAVERCVHLIGLKRGMTAET